jgi:hypothetical protein
VEIIVPSSGPILSPPHRGLGTPSISRRFTSANPGQGR